MNSAKWSDHNSRMVAQTWLPGPRASRPQPHRRREVCATAKGYAKLGAMISRLWLSIILLAVVLSATSCVGSVFKVKTVVELPPLSGEVKTASAVSSGVRHRS